MTDGRLLPAKRRLVVRGADDLVAVAVPEPDEVAVPILSPRTEGVDVVAWCSSNRERLNALREAHGAILLRGFRVGGASGLRQLALALGDQPMPYVERSSPRTRVSEDVYTSTEYASSQAILLHCENSYASHWPRHVAFHCQMPAEQGGETPIADCRRVLAALDPAIVAEFRARGVRYVRNYHPELGLSWREAFGVESRADVEAHCRVTRTAFTWSSEGVLRTWREAPAIVMHPRTRESTWFNHAAFFHVSALPRDVAHALLQVHAPEALPNQTFYGDGGVIDASTIAAINQTYDSNALRFAWRQEDTLLLDNMLCAHGRAPYSGPRRVLVSMSNRMTAAEVIAG